MATPFLSSAWFKCKDNSKLEMENQPINQPTNQPITFLCSLILTILSSSLCILGVMGNGEGKVKKKRDRGDGKDSQ